MPERYLSYRLILPCLLLFPFIGLAQSFRITQYTTHNGLPIDNVCEAAQHDNGFMWFGTDFGISRFDGSRFTHYYKKNGMANKAVPAIVYAGGDSSLFVSYPTVIQAIHGDGRISTIVDTTGFSVQQIIKHGQQYYCCTRSFHYYGVLEKGKYQLINAEKEFKIEGLLINTIVDLDSLGVAFCTNKGLFIRTHAQQQYLLDGRNVQNILLDDNGKFVLAVDGKLMEMNSSHVVSPLPYQLPPTFVVYKMEKDRR
ncbi:MAG TPA: hypothetical protein VKH37_06895, partial [Ferruginibacter sp.]|nr:hypothetical protein [Ferruginibacter sp.]